MKKIFCKFHGQVHTFAFFIPIKLPFLPMENHSLALHLHVGISAFKVFYNNKLIEVT